MKKDINTQLRDFQMMQNCLGYITDFNYSLTNNTDENEVILTAMAMKIFSTALRENKKYIEVYYGDSQDNQLYPTYSTYTYNGNTLFVRTTPKGIDEVYNGISDFFNHIKTNEFTSCFDDTIAAGEVIVDYSMINFLHIWTFTNGNLAVSNIVMDYIIDKKFIAE